MELREKDSYPDENSVALDGCRAMQGKETTMRKALILTVGLAVVLLWATSGAAHGRVFFGFGVGAPVPPFIGTPQGRVFFSSGFGVPVHPGFVTVLPSGFVSREGVVITPHTIIKPRTPVVVTIVPSRPCPQPVVVAPPVRVASPVLVTAPSVRVAPPVVIVVTSQAARGR